MVIKPKAEGNNYVRLPLFISTIALVVCSCISVSWALIESHKRDSQNNVQASHEVCVLQYKMLREDIQELRSLLLERIK